MRTSLRELSGLSLGLELVLSLVIAGAAGRWVDQRLGTAPGFMLVGTVLGLAAGLRSVFRFAESSDRRAADTTASPKSPDAPTPLR